LHITKRILTAAAGLAVIGAVAATGAQPAPMIAVVRDPGCGCCLAWVAHLQRAGFKTTVRESAERFRETAGVPGAARSCHTGSVGGYLIEGHVPVADIQRLLKERPPIAGLAVPGMPVGSPGMEQGSRRDPYDVVAFDKAGKTSIYASHR
jgi:hypothetical protein